MRWGYLALCILAVAVLAFIAGVIDTYRVQVVAPHVIRGMTAAKAVLAAQEPFQKFSWAVPAVERGGLIRSDPAAYAPGYTYYARGASPHARLLDMDGKVVHEWFVPFTKVWPDADHLPVRRPDHTADLQRIHVFDDGSLLIAFTCYGLTPYGCGLAKVNKSSHVIWKIGEAFHHDFDVSRDFGIAALTQGFEKTPPSLSVPGTPDRILNDYLVKLSHDGVLEKKLSLLALLLKAGLLDERTRLFTRDSLTAVPAWDPFHTNSIKFITSAFAAHHEWTKPGQVLVNIRNLLAVVIVDFDAERIVWASAGPWIMSHFPLPLPNGNLLLFDNWGGLVGQYMSRVLEVKPTNSAIVWSYGGRSAEPLRSPYISSVQQLSNGNILITETEGGRIIEVNRDKRVVWEYRIPDVITHEGRTLVPAVYSAGRIPRDGVTFLEPSVPR